MHNAAENITLLGFDFELDEIMDDLGPALCVYFTKDHACPFDNNRASQITISEELGEDWTMVQFHVFDFGFAIQSKPEDITVQDILGYLTENLEFYEHALVQCQECGDTKEFGNILKDVQRALECQALFKAWA